MTTQQAVDLLNILQDKYGSPSVDEDEAVDMLNMAMFEWLNRLFPSNLGGVVNFELDANTLTNVKPLVFAVTLTSNSSGFITNAAITAALVSFGAPAGSTWYRIGSLGIIVDDKRYPIKFQKHNNKENSFRNYFKKPLYPNRLKYQIQQDGIQCNIAAALSLIAMTVVKTPRLMNLLGTGEPELDDQNMYNIIAIALKLAGVATRDEELIMDIRNTALQTAQ